MLLRKFFKVKVREPYMGNELRMKIEVKIYEHGAVTVKVTNPEGIYYDADEVDAKVFNE